jgi:peptidoglycan/LPS O-acetylase OafA/YrhL
MDQFVAGDPLRGLGAIGVMMSHIALSVAVASKVDFTDGVPAALGGRFGLAGGVLLAGGLGLPIFLMLSGYLIGRPFVRAYLDARPLPSLVAYVRNRVLRIVPAFWLATTLYLILLRPGGTLGQTSAVYMFGQNLHGGALADRTQHFWSVDVEVAFYALLPVVMFLVAWLTPSRWSPRRRAGVVVALAVAAFVASAAYRLSIPSDTPGTRRLPGALCFFAPGLVMAAIEPFAVPRLAGRKVALRLAWALAAVAILLTGMVVLTVLNHGQFYSGSAAPWIALAAGPAAVAAPMVLQWGGFRTWALFRSRPLHWLGERSYSFYLLHLLPLALIAPHLASLAAGSPWDMLLALTALELLVLLPATELSYRFVEQPFLRLKRPRRSGSLRPVATPGRADRVTT